MHAVRNSAPELSATDERGTGKERQVIGTPNRLETSESYPHSILQCIFPVFMKESKNRDCYVVSDHRSRNVT